MRSEALRYAERGWHVFPTTPGEKTPLGRLVPHGLHNATTDPELITAWWTQEPEAGVGIRTGEVSNLVVVDIDGPQAEIRFTDLQRKYSAVPNTSWVLTPRGGWHVYFQHPGEKIGNTASRIGPGIDSRGDGGYVLAPPSLHPNETRYLWILEAPLAPLPYWLRLLMKPMPNLRRRPPILELASKDVAVRILREVRDIVARAPEGTRNDTLNWAAFRLGQHVARGNMSEREALDTLEDGAFACGLPSREIHNTIRSGFEDGLKKP